MNESNQIWDLSRLLHPETFRISLDDSYIFEVVLFLSKLSLQKPLIGPYAAQLGLAGQFFLAGESSVWSPLFLPLFAAIQYYKNDINQMDNLTFFAGLLPMSTMGTYL